MQVVIDGLLALLNGLFKLFPKLNIDVDTKAYLNFINILSNSLYFLPVDTCITLIKFIVSLWFFSFVVHIVKSVWTMVKPV